jgi:CHAD domain-containing protein
VLSLTVRSHAEDLLPGDQAVIAEFVARARQREHRRLVRSLDSDRYRRLLHDWQALLDEEGSEADAPNATRMLRDLVARRARRLARRITAAAAAIDEDTGATRLHRVRIDAKRLRYLVDVAPAFYDPTDIRRVLRALKRLQRVLGEFNDAHVQEVQLLACAQSLGADGTGTGAAMALGRLAEQCRNRRAQLREPVVEALTRFGDRRVRSAWRRAFAGTPDAGVAS